MFREHLATATVVGRLSLKCLGEEIMRQPCPDILLEGESLTHKVSNSPIQSKSRAHHKGKATGSTPVGSAEAEQLWSYEEAKETSGDIVN